MSRESLCCVTPAVVSGDCEEGLKRHQGYGGSYKGQTRDDHLFVRGFQRRLLPRLRICVRKSWKLGDCESKGKTGARIQKRRKSLPWQARLSKWHEIKL